MQSTTKITLAFVKAHWLGLLAVVVTFNLLALTMTYFALNAYPAIFHELNHRSSYILANFGFPALAAFTLALNLGSYVVSAAILLSLKKRHKQFSKGIVFEALHYFVPLFFFICVPAVTFADGYGDLLSVFFFQNYGIAPIAYPLWATALATIPPLLFATWIVSSTFGISFASIRRLNAQEFKESESAAKQAAIS